jgi:threonine dehydratase
MQKLDIPTLEQIKDNATKISPYILKTPVLPWETGIKNELIGLNAEVIFKCELFQKTGTFKFRGALTRILNLSEEEKKRGVVAGTGGNHGIALAYAAQLSGVHAKIVIPRTMNPLRRKTIESFDVEIVQTDRIAQVMERMEEIVKEEGLKEVNGFDHPLITLGQASLGLEFMEQIPDLDVIIVAIGGGGLASGVACAAKQIKPDIKIYGVEPKGADSMYQSFKIGKSFTLPNGPDSIADSLSAPYAGHYSYRVCTEYIDEIVLVSDDDLRDAMKILFEDVKLACEPACAASTAALIGPLKEKCRGKKTGVILCGSNIDYESFKTILSCKV